MNLMELLEVAYRLFPPFVGLVPWKFRTPVSALYHSLSVATIAGGIAELLTEDQSEVDLATYGGLVHDYYQKGPAVGLSANVGEEIVRNVLEIAGLDKKTVDTVVDEATRYNIAENPSIWAGRHPVAGLSMWLADTIAGATSALSVEASIAARASRLSDGQRKLLERLRVLIISVTLPQVALRSKIYSLVVRSLSGKHKIVPVVARDGLIIVSTEELGDPALDIDELRAEETELESIRDASGARELTFNERFKPELFIKGSPSRLVLDESVEQLMHGLRLVGVEVTKRSKYRCVFCGLPADEPIHPASVGYTLYGSSSMERWSPRVPAVGVNLNRLMQSGWLKHGIVACPLCVIDAIEVWRLMKQSKINTADYFMQLYFPLPTHYELAELFSRIAYYTLPLQKGAKERVTVEVVAESYEDPEQYAKQAHELVKTREDTVLLVDSTWAQFFCVLGARDGELETFATYLPYLARAVLFTGVYPLKFSSKLDPLSERRLLSPVYPLYDVDPVSEQARNHVPLIIALLSIIGNLDDESPRKKREDVNAAMEYLRYPSMLVPDLLLRHSVGRRALEAYKRFRENPAEFFAQLCGS